MPFGTNLSSIASIDSSRFVSNQFKTDCVSNGGRHAAIDGQFSCHSISIVLNCLYSTHPVSDTCSQCTVFVCVPFDPHGAEHFPHLLSAQRGGHESLPQRWLSVGFAVLSHKPSSTCSNVVLLLQVTLLLWEPPPHSDKHGPNGPYVHAYVSCSS